MSTIPTIESKYHLKSIHAEIDLFDRRLAHLNKYDVFETEAARAAAARKLNLKRDPLVVTAKRLVAEGVEYKESDLPRSFRPEGVPAPVEAKPEPEPVAASPQPRREPFRPPPGFALRRNLPRLGKVCSALYAEQVSQGLTHRNPLRSAGHRAASPSPLTTSRTRACRSGFASPISTVASSIR